MPKKPRLTAADAEKLLQKAGFVWVPSKGSHRIYQRGSERMVVPFRPGRVLHPKIVKQITQTLGN